MIWNFQTNLILGNRFQSPLFPHLFLPFYCNNLFVIIFDHLLLLFFWNKFCCYSFESYFDVALLDHVPLLFHWTILLCQVPLNLNLFPIFTLLDRNILPSCFLGSSLVVTLLIIVELHFVSVHACVLRFIDSILYLFEFFDHVFTSALATKIKKL